MIAVFLSATAIFLACNEKPTIADYKIVPLQYSQIEKLESVELESTDIKINELLGPEGASCTKPSIGKYVIKGEYDFSKIANKFDGTNQNSHKNPEAYLKLGFGQTGTYVISYQKNFTVPERQHKGNFEASVVLESKPAPQYISLTLIIDETVACIFLIK